MKTAATTLLIGTLLVPTWIWGTRASAQPAPTPATSLHVAVLVGDIDAVRAHVAAGADLDERDAFGSTPLLIAATFDRPDAVRALLDAGADPDLANADGGTPLHTAAFLAREEIVRLLLDAGANRYLRDAFGSTPLGSVSRPFDEVRAFYDAMAAGLAPLGLELDYDRIRAARPAIAELLRPPAAELAAVDYAPVERGDWPVSTPDAEGLDPDLVAELYLNAPWVGALDSLLVLRHGRLVAEAYFHDGEIDRTARINSVSKSVLSALVGIALERGCLESLDATLLEFFPEFGGRIDDPRKAEITLRELLQMRGGFAWEETDPELWSAIASGWLLEPMIDFPLTLEPGSGFQYSNLSTHWLGVVVARACDTDLGAFAEANLFAPLGIEPGPWRRDRDGYRLGAGDLYFTPRDAARFGQLYLDDGVWRGAQIVPSDWVRASLERWSEDTFGRTGAFRDIGYGYQWWSATAGEHRVDYAWGHGGQLIVLERSMDLIVVTTAYPAVTEWLRQDTSTWPDELAVLTLVSEFIEALPSE